MLQGALGRVGSRGWVLGIWVMLLLAFMTGCGSGGASTPSNSSGSTSQSGMDPSSSTTPPPIQSTEQPSAGGDSETKPTEKPEPKLWKHGTVVPKADAGFIFMAEAKDFFGEEGLKVEYTLTQDSTTLLKALLSGELDSVEIGPSGAFGAAEKGAPVKVVAATLPGLPHVVYARADIEKVEDLKGKNIGSGQVGSFTDTMMRAILEKHGIGINDVNYVQIGGSGVQFQALLAGKIDALAGASDFVLEAEQNPDIKVLTPVVKELSDYLRFTIITRDDIIQKRPDDLLGFLKAEAKGIRYAMTHRDEALKVAAEKTQVQPDDPSLSFVYDQYVRDGLVAPNLEVPESGVRFTQEIGVSIGAQEKVLPYEQVVDASFQQKVIQELGPFQS